MKKVETKSTRRADMEGEHYQIELKIANLKSSLGKENQNIWAEDYDYTDENLEKVFADCSKKVSKKDIAQLDYMRKSMPGQTEMENIVRDIMRFYEQNFMMYTLEEPYKFKIRFFLHVKFMGEDGDTLGDKIRIGCKNLAASNILGVSFPKFIDSLQYEKADYFKDRLRNVIAHEIYHIMHFKHCDLINKKHDDSECKELLNEIFANYFSYEYVNDFLQDPEFGDPDYYNQRRNAIFDWYTDIKYFGVGRKYLFPDVYSKVEIEDDEKRLDALKEDGMVSRIVETKNYPVSTAEYAAGFFLSYYEKKHHDELGEEADRPLYTKMYKDYMLGEADKALLRLIKIKEEEYR